MSMDGIDYALWGKWTRADKSAATGSARCITHSPVYELGNTYCRTCHKWLHGGEPTEEELKSGIPATGSGEATWMHDAAARINQIQAMRGHVLRAANGDTNPVMPEDEMVNIMQQYAPLTPPSSHPTVTAVSELRKRIVHTDFEWGWNEAIDKVLVLLRAAEEKK